MEHKNISILGATGSIGKQTLEVVSLSEKTKIRYLTTNTNIEQLESQCREFNPLGVVISDENAFSDFKDNTTFKGEILFGDEGLDKITSDTETDILVSALVGLLE